LFPVPYSVYNCLLTLNKEANIVTSSNSITTWMPAHFMDRNGGQTVRYATCNKALAHIKQTQYQGHSRYSEFPAEYKLIKQLPIHCKL